MLTTRQGRRLNFTESCRSQQARLLYAVKNMWPPREAVVAEGDDFIKLGKPEYSSMAKSLGCLFSKPREDCPHAIIGLLGVLSNIEGAAIMQLNLF